MSKTVAITGASGFIGSHIVEAALQQGFHVVALVHHLDDTKLAHLHSLSQKYHGVPFQLQSADLTQPGSYDNAFKVSDIVIHCAGKLSTGKKSTAEEAQNIIQANQYGCENILNSIKKSPRIRKVIYTASIASVIGNKKHRHPYKASDYNEDSLHETDSYSWSKTQAEKQLQNGIQSLKNHGREIDFVSIAPSMVIGPVLTPQHIRTSMGMLTDICFGNRTEYADFYFHFVDVRDVANVHINALKDSISGRFILPGTPSSLLNLSALIKKQFPHLNVPQKKIPTWKLYLTLPFNPNLSWNFLRKYLNLNIHFDDSNTIESFNLNYRNLEQTLRDSVNSLQKILGR